MYHQSNCVSVFFLKFLILKVKKLNCVPCKFLSSRQQSLFHVLAAYSIYNTVSQRLPACLFEVF